MFPIRDHNPSSRTPYVTYALIALNIIIYLSYTALYTDPAALNWFYAHWALIPQAISDGTQMRGLVTSMFLHGGLLHIGGNMLFLWIFGDNLEDELGHLRYLGYYLACGVAAGLAQYLAAPQSPVPTIGASGAIAGIMGGYLLMFPKARVDVLFIFIIFFRIFALPAWLILGVWFGLQLFNGASAAAGAGGVAYWEHVGGFVIGVVLMLPVWLRLGGPAYWGRTRGLPPHPEAQYARSHVPVIRRRR